MKRKPIHKMGTQYPTLGRYVYLGPHPRKKTIKNAKSAGLIKLNLRQFRQLNTQNMAIQRIMGEGYWVESVQYDAPIYGLEWVQK